MKKIHLITKSILSICLLMLAVSWVSASEAEYKKLTKSFTLHADGSQEMRFSMELILFTHTAMNSTYGESFIVYNPEFQQLKINASYTKQKDGKIIQAPENAFVEVLPAAAAHAPAYNGLKEMVVVHTGLELGATIYLDYTLVSKPGYLPELDVYEEIIQSSPVDEYVITLAAPVSKTITYASANLTAAPVERVQDGVTSLTWTLKKVPASSRNPFVAAANGDVPYLTATTYASTADALQFLAGQFNPPTDVQLQTIAENLTDGTEGTTNRLAAILAYVNQRFANNGLLLEQTGYRLRNASDVFSTAYGTEAEKVNLLNGLLNCAGFDAEPVAIYRMAASKGLGLKGIANLSVLCKADGKTYLFSPRNTQPDKALLLAGAMPVYALSNGQPVALPAPAETAISAQTTVSFNQNQLVTDTRENVGSDLLPYFVNGTKEEQKSTALQPQNGYITWLLPEPAQAFANQPYGRMNSERGENLMLPRPVDESYTYSIVCPANLSLSSRAFDKTIQNAAGQCIIKLVKSGNEATVTRSLKLNKQLYTPAEFKALRQLLTVWSDPNTKTLIFSEQ